MLTHSTINLVLIRSAIFCLQCAPLVEAILLFPLLYGTISNHKPISPPLIILASLLALEAAYYLAFYRPHKARLLTTKATHPSPSLTRSQRQALFDKCAANIPDFEFYIRGWFLNAPLSEIHRDNVREFLLWAFFDHDHDDNSTPLSPESESQINSLITQCETLLNQKFPPGRGPPTTRSLRLTIDPIQTRYRSVLWFFIITLTDAITHLHLQYLGNFTYHAPSNSPQSSFPPRLSHLPWVGQKPSSAKSASYYLRPHPPGSSNLPVVFLHGIGIGLWPYRSFLSSLAPTSGVLALELLPISSRLTSPLLSKPQFQSELTHIISTLGWDKTGFVLVTHSYGSVLATHLIHSPAISPCIKGIVLVDPVTILLHLPAVAYNFTRRQPKKANEHQLHYFASTDLGIAEGLGRYFFWRENIIWKEELLSSERKVAVALAGKDLIVDTKSVARYLAGEGKDGLREVVQSGDYDETKSLFEESGEGGSSSHSTRSGIEILWFPKLDHAQAFESQKDMESVLDVVRRFCLVSQGGETRKTM
ncbi:hypothetical protein QBC43DRAFT_327275 [Cladorrhinum sp. PSN259]|nr:hypothetical protein QBC43DRAFT_327275 [Cladorrhinum sp. PSN259]